MHRRKKMSTKTKSPIGQRTVIGFDFGKKYIGVAVGQEMTGSATPLGSVKAVDGIPHWANLAKFLKEWQPDFNAIGLPLNMDVSEQQLTLDAKEFGTLVHGRCGIPVDFQDELFTTADAKEQLLYRGGLQH